ncbi:MAG TPA: sigma-70 family RNA polymerase sigma factor [Gemmataceae bacterium]
MASDQSPAILRHIRRLTAEHANAARTDRELLHRFGTHHDETAFAALVRRHGPLVLGVCRRVLRQEQDAEDVFQATFLLLARKAASRGWRDSIGGWLYRVAYRLAVRARRQTSRRLARERQAVDRRADDPLAEVTLREAQQTLDDELNRLSDKFRVPIVLCCLEGRTRDEAAKQIGWSVATLKRRLERGRELLAARLRRRGLTLGALLAGLTYSEGAASSSMPVALLTSTVSAALSDGAAPALISAQTAWLLRGAWQTVLLSKGKTLFGAVFGVVLIAGMSAVLLRSSPPTEQQAASPPKENPTPRADRGSDPLPAGAVLRLGSLRLRHKTRINSLAFASGGDVLIAAGDEGTIHFWKPATGEKLRSLDGAGALAVSPDGKTLAAWQGDTVALWDVATGERLRKLSRPSAKVGRSPIPLRFAPDGRTIAGLVGENSASVWDVATGREQVHLPAHEKPIVCLGFTSDGKGLLTATGARQEDIILRQWDAASGKEQHTIRVPAPKRQAWLRPLTFSADGKTLALEEAATARRKEGAVTHVFTEYRLYLLDVATGREQRRLDATTSVVWSAAFSRDGRSVACQRMDGSVSVWDAASGKVRFTHRGYPGGSRPDSHFTLDFTPDGKRLATAGESGVIDLWDVETGRELFANAETHHGAIACLVFAPDGKTVATGGDDHTIRLWDAATGRQRRCLVGHTRSVRRVVFSHDGQTLVSASEDDTIRLWDTTTGKERYNFKEERAPRSMHFNFGVHALAFTPDGQTLVSWGEDRMLRTWNLTARKESSAREISFAELPSIPDPKPGEPHPDFPQDHIQWAAFTPDARTVLLASNKTIHLVDVASGREVFTFASPSRLWSLDLSPDGQTLFAGCADKTIHLFEVATGKEILRTLLPEIARPAAFTADGRSLAVAVNAKKIIRILDVAKGEEQGKYTDLPAQIRSLAFRSDGRMLAGGLSNSTALLWKATIPAARRGEKKLAADKLDELWDHLAGADATKAHAALWTLTAHSAQAETLLSARLRPAPSVDPKHIEALIAQLNHAEFAKREEASRELKKLGAAAEKPLRAALERPASEEMRRRLRDLLAAPPPWTPQGPEALRRRRAIQLLERLGSPAADRILDKLARGDALAVETHLAEEARKRLARRGR